MHILVWLLPYNSDSRKKGYDIHPIFMKRSCCAPDHLWNEGGAVRISTLEGTTGVSGVL